MRPRFFKTNNMFKHEGFCYDLFVRPWKKGDARYEALRWPIGQKHLWEHIPYKQYIEAKNQQHETK